MMRKTSLITGEILRRLEACGITAKKKLGQNFLVNEGVYRKITAALGIRPSDTIVEIGPGLGTLTDYLTAAKRVIAIEKDSRLADYLKSRYHDNPNVQIVEGDILKFAPRAYSLKLKAYNLVGNIPYYLTSHLLKTVFDNWPLPKLVVLTLQKEVAQRITAKPPKMNLLAVSVQYHAIAEIVAYISRGSFYPTPKVDSAIVRIRPYQRKRPTKFDSFLFKAVKAGFGNKRKQLLNNLSIGLKMPKEKLITKLRSIGITPSRRAETLTLEEWQKISQIIG